MLAQEGIFLFIGILIVAIISYYFSIFIHEFGHLVCGLISGYHFSSFSFLGFTLSQTKNRLALRRDTFASGMGGQCLMTPPENPHKLAPYRLLNYGGVIANFFMIFLAGLPLFMSTTSILLTVMLSLSIFFNLFGVIMNGLPFTISGLPNDAKNVQLIGQSPVSQQAFYIGSLLDSKKRTGLRLSEIPYHLLNINDTSTLDNLYVGYINWQRCLWFADADMLDKAVPMMRKFQKSLPHYQTYSYYYCDYVSNMIFYYLLSGTDPQIIKQLRTEDYLEYSKKLMSPIFCLSEIAYYHFFYPKQIANSYQQAYIESIKKVTNTGQVALYQHQYELLKKCLQNTKNYLETV